jgi:uncharacterized membrane protein
LTLCGGALYAVASHQLMTHAAASPFALAAVLGPICVGLLLGLWRAGHRVLAAVLGMVGMALAAVSTQRQGVSPEWLYLAQHAGVHAGLGLWFGSTLRGPGLPLISQIAKRVHHGLEPAMAAYTRGVTLVWTLYFLAMTAASLALFAGAPFAAWSLFASVFTPVSAVLLFVGEHLLRYRLHPEFERVGLMDAVRAYSERGRPEPRPNL